MSGNEEIRKTIIQATRKLISQKTSITVRDIADACFVNVAAINYYFGSKDQLLSIVLDELIQEIIQSVVDRLNWIPPQTDPKDTLEIMIDMIYQYAVEHVGLIDYLFLNVENRDRASKLFVDAFYRKGEFKSMVFRKLRESSGLQDEQALNARYVMLLSCFCIPLIMQILKEPYNEAGIPSLEDTEFRKHYIQELIKMIK